MPDPTPEEDPAGMEVTAEEEPLAPNVSRDAGYVAGCAGGWWWWWWPNMDVPCMAGSAGSAGLPIDCRLSLAGILAKLKAPMEAPCAAFAAGGQQLLMLAGLTHPPALLPDVDGVEYDVMDGPSTARPVMYAAR